MPAVAGTTRLPYRTFVLYNVFSAVVFWLIRRHRRERVSAQPDA